MKITLLPDKKKEFTPVRIEVVIQSEEELRALTKVNLNSVTCIWPTSTQLLLDGLWEMINATAREKGIIDR